MVYKQISQHKTKRYLFEGALTFFLMLTSCESKMNVSVKSGTSTSAQQTSSDIANQVNISLSNRNLDKNKSASIASAAGKAGANASTSGSNVEAQSRAALLAAVQTIFEQFSNSSDISIASQASFEAIATWLNERSSPRTPEASIKSATNSVLNAIAGKSSSASDPQAVAAISGIFSYPSDISVDGRSLINYTTAVMTGIVTAMGSDAKLNEIAQSAASQLTTADIRNAISAGNLSSAIAALLKGVTNAGSDLTSENAKLFLEIIAENAATAIADSSLSASSKNETITTLKAAIATAVDTLASLGTIPNANVPPYKAGLESIINTAAPDTTPSAPEINLKQGVTNLASGVGSQSFGSAGANTGTVDITFTVENLGNSILHLTSTPTVSISGVDASDFSVTAVASATVAASGTQSFTIRFAPTSAGSKMATVNIANDDSDEASYTFAITGTGIVGPEINVKQGATNIASGSGSQSFGSVTAAGGTADLVFTIENLGNTTLNLSGTPRAALSGANAADFSVTSAPAATVAASGTQTFTVRFAPSAGGARTATVTIDNDDSDEGTYTFTITGTGTTSPEINVKQGVTSLASGSGSQSFGSVAAGGGTADLVFTIENTGTATLNLSGTPRAAISGTNASDFSVTSAPPATVAASGSQTFTVRFAPAAGGAKTATITVVNDDSNEGTYTFTVTGTGTTAPEINIKQSTTSLASGSGSQSFGSVVANSATADLIFTVENTGTAVLNLSGTPKAALSGADAAMFSVTSAPAATVAASGTTSFTIRFTPTATGAKTATVTVANDDSDEGTYTFTITGTGTAAPAAGNYVEGVPGTVGQANGGALISNWANLSNATSDDGASTTAALDDDYTTSSELLLTNFNFPSIPASATIDGIKLEIKQQVTGVFGGASCKDLVVSLTDSGATSGSNLAKATAWPTTATYATYGSSTELWGNGFVPADINLNRLGVLVQTQALTAGLSGCIANVDAVKVTIYYTPAAYQIFTTSTTYTGNLGGLAGADAICQARATAASLTGTWKALMSDATTSANTRLIFAPGITFVNMFGSTVATSTTALWDNDIDAPLNLSEFGVAAGALDIWTGTNLNGSASTHTCNSWTSASNGVTAAIGVGGATDFNWINSSFYPCDRLHQILCISQ